MWLKKDLFTVIYFIALTSLQRLLLLGTSSVQETGDLLGFFVR